MSRVGMKTANKQFPIDVLQCIAIGVDTQSKIIDYLNCSSSTLCILLRKLVVEGTLEVKRIGMHNQYSLRTITTYNDPFRLAKPNKSTNTFALPPRRQHTMDCKRLAA